MARGCVARLPRDLLVVSESPWRPRRRKPATHLLRVGEDHTFCGIDAGEWYIQPTDEATCPRCKRSRNLK
jgi:hypothetical protein